MYQIAAGTEIQEVESRVEAIEMAKDLSTNTRRPVVVQDEDETEFLTYKEGALSKYQYEPRRRRR